MSRWAEEAERIASLGGVDARNELSSCDDARVLRQLLKIDKRRIVREKAEGRLRVLGEAGVMVDEDDPETEAKVQSEREVRQAHADAVKPPPATPEPVPVVEPEPEPVKVAPPREEISDERRAEIAATIKANADKLKASQEAALPDPQIEQVKPKARKPAKPAKAPQKADSMAEKGKPGRPPKVYEPTGIMQTCTRKGCGFTGDSGVDFGTRTVNGKVYPQPWDRKCRAQAAREAKAKHG